jgi:hypothetical protein
LFFDADGDKDLDLLVLSGGAEAASPDLWLSRLYMNDGKGGFDKAPEGSLPNLKDLGLRACAYDYDQDGDQDLSLAAD